MRRRYPILVQSLGDTSESEPRCIQLENPDDNRCLSGINLPDDELTAVCLVSIRAVGTYLTGAPSETVGIPPIAPIRVQSYQRAGGPRSYPLSPPDL
jgi:hypothetical protein